MKDLLTNMQRWIAESGEAAGLPARLVNAARSGHDVDEDLRLEVSNRVAVIVRRLSGDQYVRRDVEDLDHHNDDWSTTASSVRDRLRVAERAIAREAALPGACATVGPVVRVRLTPGGNWRSAVDVSVYHSWYEDVDLGCFVLTEPRTSGV